MTSTRDISKYSTAVRKDVWVINSLQFVRSEFVATPTKTDVVASTCSLRCVAERDWGGRLGQLTGLTMFLQQIPAEIACDVATQ